MFVSVMIGLIIGLGLFLGAEQLERKSQENAEDGGDWMDI